MFLSSTYFLDYFLKVFAICTAKWNVQMWENPQKNLYKRVKNILQFIDFQYQIMSYQEETKCDDEIEHLFSMFHLPILITILIQSRMKNGYPEFRMLYHFSLAF